ncbi:energy transducer TonB [Flavihumibacter solisilvae]|uniref:energy transducer TonB n=1 Tax=Flavihumibacter solisilvae TaxID=1349421 RepID=UPI0006907489|nr:energy transducer TonB [Flavihumibacter solisilvae]
MEFDTFSHLNTDETSNFKMHKACTLLVFLLMSIVSYAQTKTINADGIEMKISAADSSINEAFLSCGQMPEFPGGMTKLISFAKSKIKYPKTAVNDNIEGSVVLLFTIDKRGKVINQEVVQNVRYDLDSVCLRMLDKMPKWKPGRLNSKPIDVRERWKITFVLTD